MDILQVSNFTGCLSKAGLGIAGTADRVKITAPNGAGVDFAINGIAYHKADTDNIDTGAAAVQAVDTTCLYLIQLDVDGALTVVKGNEVLTVDLTAGTNNCQWPSPSANNCPIGGVKVVTVAVTFTLATTDFSAAGVTETWYDFALGLPAVPQT